MALETASTGIECPGLPAYQAHMVPPASRTPPAALHQPTLGDYFSFKLQNLLSSPGPTWLRAGTLSPGDLPPHRQRPLQDKLVCCGGKLERGRKRGKKERNGVPTPFGPLARHLGFRNKLEKPTALEGHKICWRQIE